ncbi:MAG: GTPase ObgE [Candidatus Hydrogenedentes bacterium]|nr:GTPase ObgE [Candidatus Hydrogenedentota bacterium]
MFIDRARIRVTGGAGGKGCSSMRREKYVPRGGPDGGDGGNGGDVYFVAATRFTSLLDLQYHAHWIAEGGVHGKGSDCHGKNGSDLLIQVPLGTLVRNLETNEVMADLVEEGQRFLAAHGGRGGRGNARFASSTNRAPKFAELGEPGENAEFLVELKLIAEVGLVGLPNAGKSTFLAAASAARPKIADYPFTTLSPNLGVSILGEYRTLTIADIPGIIEGAAEGKGLGHDFLRHIERTKVLLFLIDLGDPDPVQTCATLENELAQHSAAFADKPKVYALNKVDITENRERSGVVSKSFDSPAVISAATGEGVPELLERMWQTVAKLRKEEAEVPSAASEHDYTYEPPYVIRQTDAGFQVDGAKVVQAVRMTDFSNEEAIRHLQKRLKRMGVYKALKRLGAEEGQTVMIGDAELEYHAD